MISEDTILVFFCCLSSLYTTSMTQKISSLLPWWQGSSSKRSKYLCKLFKLICLILPGINDEALTGTLHMENVFSHAYLMLLEVSEKCKYFLLSRETAYGFQFTLYMEAVGVLLVFLNTLWLNFPNGLLIERVHDHYSRFLFLMEGICFLFS